MPVAREVLLSAVEDLTDLGTGRSARRLSRVASAALSGRNPAPDGDGERWSPAVQFDLICPDNGRTIRSYRDKEELPIGQEVSSDRCDSAEPFVVEPQHILTEALVEAVAEGDLDAVGILLAAGADPDAAGADGRSARRRALTAGVAATVELLGGGGDDPVDRLLEAIVTGDEDAARSLAAAVPGLVDGLEGAEHGNLASVGLMLELGFPIEARREATTTTAPPRCIPHPGWKRRNRRAAA